MLRDIFTLLFSWVTSRFGRSWWPRVLRRRFAAARLLGLRVRNPQPRWSLCDEPITRSDNSYRICCVSVIVKLRYWGAPGPRGAIASREGGSFVISLLIIPNLATELASHSNAGRVAESDPRSWPDKIMNLYNYIVLKKINSDVIRDVLVRKWRKNNSF